MITKKLRSASFIVVLAVVGITTVITVEGLWKGPNGTGWDRTLRSDAVGYYGYLQAIFLRNDLGHEPFIGEYTHHSPEGRTLNKYFCGTGLMMSPWFGIGHAFAMNDPEVPQDGKSVYEQKAIAIGAWAYMLLGLLALRSLFLGLGARDGVVAWIIAGLALGTPLVQYVAIQPGWSHVYSFFLISTFMLVVHRLAKGRSPNLMFVAAALLGVIVLVRPINGMVLLAIPIVAGPETRGFFIRLFERKVKLVLAGLLCAGIVGLQPLLWYLQTGNFIEWGYESEGFYWTRPEVIKVLFGFRRGLFLWTPFMILVAGCAVLIWRTDRWRSAWSLAYWAVATYIISCWWIWYYGGGFASRVYIDHYPILAIPLVLVLQQWNARWWTAARVYITLCIGLNLAQLWQYHNGIIHHDCMDREKYLFTFLRFDADHTNKLGGNYEEAPYHPNGMRMIITESCDLDNPCRYWKGNWTAHPNAFSIKNVAVFDKNTEFSLMFEAGTDTIPVGRWLFMEIGLQRFEATAQASLPLLAVTEVRNKRDKVVHYKPFPINPVPGTPGQWEQLEYRIPVPPLSDGDRLRFYFWNMDRKADALIDDVFMRVSATNQY